MINLDQLRKYMKREAEEDRQKKSIQVTGTDVDDALSQASIELGVSVKDLEFEILDPGNKGVMGFGKKDCLLIVYEIKKETDDESSFDELPIDTDSDLFDEVEENTDGKVIISLSSEGVLLKVKSPIGKGKKATVKNVVEKLTLRDIDKYDSALVVKIVKNADNQFIKIGDFIYNPANDAILTVDLVDMEMKSYINVMPPGPGGIDLSRDSILSFLKNNQVIHGILEDKIDEFIESPIYKEAFLIAEGTIPVNGKDAKIIYNFEIEKQKLHLKEKNGKVDFKELNLVQNVVEGQALAKKIEAESGLDGRTVTGKLIPANDGKDLLFEVGKNVNLSDDGTTAIAGVNGQVMLLNNKVSVETVHVVNGDVNLKTGNIIFLGTVLVKGSVDDGFTIKAAGNIEVMGNVGKCDLDAEGDIIVHQGINGKLGSNIKAGKGVWSKFIENAKVNAGTVVVVSDGIINSNVDADKKVICNGKRATIVGGKIRASEEVVAKTLGSIAGAETLAEVGFDPKSKERLVEIEDTLQDLEKELDELNLNIRTIMNIRKIKKQLPPEKMAYLKELSSSKAEKDNLMENLNNEKESLNNYLGSLKVVGRISVSGKVFTGVRVTVKDATLEIRNEYRAVTFINESNLVKVTKYEEPDELDIDDRRH